jgi:hypothetical protein
MLDQFLINKSMATGAAPIKINPATVQIPKPPAMVNPGVYPKPIPFGVVTQRTVGIYGYRCLLAGADTTNVRRITRPLSLDPQ